MLLAREIGKVYLAARHGPTRERITTPRRKVLCVGLLHCHHHHGHHWMRKDGSRRGCKQFYPGWFVLEGMVC